MTIIPSLFNGTVSASACSAATIPYPTLFGAEFLSLEANYVSNFTEKISIGYYPNHGGVDVQNASFCNVSISYTHPGENDTVRVQVWLPTEWNGRLQAIGGGGWIAGLDYSGLKGMTAAMGEGYTAVGTDAGLGTSPDYLNLFSNSPSSWALVSEGNPNMYLLQNFASVSLNDAAVISKAVAQSYYGQPPVYSYFTGCSGGGRQGYMLAQRYPDAYNGIAASSPAISWPHFFMESYYPYFVMDKLQTYPASCELNAITQAAIDACDANDGLVDGIISREQCDFKASSAVGTIFNCTDTGLNQTVSSGAATLMQAVWDGMKNEDNSTFWYGPSKDAILTGANGGLIQTTCSANGTCAAEDVVLFSSWIRYFILKNSSAVLDNFSLREWHDLAHASVQQYDSIVGTNDPDLTEFRKLGGKLVSFHGMTDALIPIHGTEAYYDAVMEKDPSVHDYYRFFSAPGVEHCFGGSGAFPDTTFDAMREWVENGVAPDVLEGTSVGTTPIIKRNLCPYPQQQYYDGTGNQTTAEAFYCK